MLNDTQIKSLKFTGKPQKHFDGGDTYLLVTTTGSRLEESLLIAIICLNLQDKKY